MFTSGKALTALITESRRLADAIKEGKLQARANPEAVAPQFRPVLEAMNAMTDAVVGPINVTAEYVDRDLQGRHPGEDHRHVPRRLQRNQEQPQRLHRRAERPDRRHEPHVGRAQ